MPVALRSPAVRRLGFALLAAFVFAFAGHDLEAEDILDCGRNSPAYPVPEFHGSVRLWPNNGFRPARPGQQLPADRDSTQYITQTPPGAEYGHELYWAIDVLGDRAFTMYNVGLSVWDIGGAFAENPRRLDFRDGILGHWLHHDTDGEADGFLNDIAVIQDPSNPNRVLIAVAAATPIGTTLWRFDRSTGRLSQTFQDVRIVSEDVEMIVHGGRAYAIFADYTGAFVLDATAANAIPEGGCLDGDCPPGIYLGKIGSAAGGPEDSRYLGVIERGGKVYVATSLGGLNLWSPKTEIWELDPALPAAAVRRFSGASFDTHSPVFFVKGGVYYMAAVQDRTIKIFNMDACLDSNGCTFLPAPTWQRLLPSQRWPFDYLSYSVSEGTPFLYYGFEAQHPKGPTFDGLFDLTNLGGSNQITEITATGGSFIDACNGLGPISYWSYHYERNDTGLQYFNPRKGKFSGRYFYRVNASTFDVHVRTVVNPTITTAVVTPPPHYFGDSLNFSATADNCAGPDSWTWHSSNAGASGLEATGSSATLNWPLCGGNHCQSEVIDVWALKASCAGAGNLTQNRATISVADPRPQIASISVAPTPVVPDTYPLCSQLSFTADVSGKAPLGHAWRVRNRAGEQIASGNSPAFGWNTSGVILELPSEIFYDGFESGGVGAWNLSPAAPLPQAVGQKVIEDVMGTGSAIFDVELTVSNSTGSPASLIREITLTALGDLAFTGTPIEATNLGGGQFRFRANTANATRWRWEFEDPGNGTVAGCQFFSKCRILEFGAEDNDVTTAWASPNLDGTYRVRVQAANCLTSVAPIAAELPVPVSGIPAGSPPAIATFAIAPGGHCSLSLNVMECHLQAIGFTVGHTGTASHFDFDWEGDGAFEQSIPVGNPISHTYTTIGIRFPKVRARNGAGAPSSGVGLPWGLLILP